MNIVQFGQTNSHTHAKVIFVVEIFNNKKNKIKHYSFCLCPTHPSEHCSFSNTHLPKKEKNELTHPPRYGRLKLELLFDRILHSKI